MDGRTRVEVAAAVDATTLLPVFKAVTLADLNLHPIKYSELIYPLMPHIFLKALAADAG